MKKNCPICYNNGEIYPAGNQPTKNCPAPNCEWNAISMTVIKGHIRIYWKALKISIRMYFIKLKIIYLNKLHKYL